MEDLRGQQDSPILGLSGEMKTPNGNTMRSVMSLLGFGIRRTDERHNIHNSGILCLFGDHRLLGTVLGLPSQEERMPQKYSNSEITAHVFRIVRANQDKPKTVIMKMLRDEFGTSKAVWDMCVQALKELSQ